MKKWLKGVLIGGGIGCAIGLIPALVSRKFYFLMQERVFSKPLLVGSKEILFLPWKALGGSII